MAPVITLLTDFGREDEYVAAMKGVMLSILPEATLVDISHAVPPGNIFRGAFLLERAFRFFPPGTVHLAVVDPGVGTKRKILAVAAESQFFIAPDNGILTPVLHSGAVTATCNVTNKALFLTDLSATFHGRDIMAPVAAHIAAGLPIRETGLPFPPEECVRMPRCECRLEQGRIVGRVVSIDHFGNLCTNIHASIIAEAEYAGAPLIELGAFRLGKISTTYGDMVSGSLLALFDSHGQLEISVAGGSAAAATGAEVGSVVTVRSRS